MPIAVRRIEKQLTELKGVERVRVMQLDDTVTVTVFHQEFLTNPFKVLKAALPGCQLTQHVTHLGRQCVSRFVLHVRPFLLTDVANVITDFLASHPIRTYPDVVIRRDEHDHRFTQYGCPRVFHQP